MSVDAPSGHSTWTSSGPAPAWRRSLGSGSTTPERLFRVALVLVVGCLATALVSVLAGMARTASVAEAQTRIAALTTDSAELYRSLADADAMATSGYVSGGREPTAVRARYDDDIARGHRPAGRRRRTAARQRAGRHGRRRSCPSTPGWSRPPARSTGRGCRSASPTWAARRSSCAARSCPAAEELRRQQAAELDRGLRARRRDPVRGRRAARGHAGRDRRRLAARAPPHPPHASASGCSPVRSRWWPRWRGGWSAVGVANGRLETAQRHSDAVTALDDARTAVLQARSAESLALVARSARLRLRRRLHRRDREGRRRRRGERPARPRRRRGAGARRTGSRRCGWRSATGRPPTARSASSTTAASYTARGGVGGQPRRPGGSGAAFDALDAALGGAIDEERAAFADATGVGRVGPDRRSSPVRRCWRCSRRPRSRSASDGGSGSTGERRRRDRREQARP